MDDEKIIRYISNNTTGQKEKEEIRNWINTDSSNKQYFILLKNIFALSRKSANQTDANSEYLKFSRLTFNNNKRYLVSFLKYAAIIFITIGATWLATYELSDFSSTQQYEVICPPGQISQLILSDGTKVWLNSDSKIICPSDFNGKFRSVDLIGEAFFDVAKNEKVPFFVRTGSLNIKVLGTSFNVDVYRKNEIRTTLVEGKIEVENNNGKKIAEMLPGQLARYDIKERKIYISTTDVRLYSSWKDGKMTFFDSPLEEIAEKLERWYNVKITFNDDEIKKYRFSSTILKSKPLDQILEVIKISSSINYQVVINPEGRNEIILTKK